MKYKADAEQKVRLFLLMHPKFNAHYKWTGNFKECKNSKYVHTSLFIFKSRNARDS